jgi:hypothetical protein
VFLVIVGERLSPSTIAVCGLELRRNGPAERQLRRPSQLDLLDRDPSGDLTSAS